MMMTGNDFLSASTQESLLKNAPSKSQINIKETAYPISAWVSIRKTE
jgi:hypothetical protein